MAVDAMQEVAQGRVWSGRDALSMGLVDALGGVSRAVAVAKQAAGLGAPCSGCPSPHQKPTNLLCGFCCAAHTNEGSAV